MASRRKSSRPTNKLRQIQSEADEGEAATTLDTIGHYDEVTEISFKEEDEKPEVLDGRLLNPAYEATNTSLEGPSMSSNTLLLTYRGHDNNFLSSNVSAAVSAGAGQNIALSTDVLSEFEALKSATNLDSSQLIRKLLKDYQKLSSSHSSDTRNESPAVHAMRDAGEGLGCQKKASPSCILDLSVHRHSGEETSSSAKPQPEYLVLTDDQIAMGNFAMEDLATPARPLDLTVPKQTASSFGNSDIHVDKSVNDRSASSLFSASFPRTSIASSEIPRKRHADMYVINLESNVTHPTTTVTSAREYYSMVPTSNTILPSAKETNVSYFTYDHNDAPSPTSYPVRPKKRVEQISGDSYEETSSSPDTHGPDSLTLPLALESLSLPLSHTLPSYKQAIAFSASTPMTEHLQSTQQSIREKIVMDETSNHLDLKGKQVSVLRLKPGILDNKGLLDIDSDERVSDHSKVNTSLSNTTSGVLKKQHETVTSNWSLSDYGSSTPLSSSVSQISTLQISCPNLFNSSPSINVTQDSSTSIRSTVPSSISGTPSSISGAMQLPAIIMATDSEGVVGNVLAIPIFQGISEETNSNHSLPPHPAASTTSIRMSLTPNSVPKDAPLTMSSTADNPILVPLSQPSHIPTREYLNNVDYPATKKLKSDTATKSGKKTETRHESNDTSRKTGTKSIKLLTENTLFPGVYTSILKLPWSKRTRNRTKSKNSPEKKKRQSKTVQNKSQTKEKGKNRNHELEKRLTVSHLGESKINDIADAPILSSMQKNDDLGLMSQCFPYTSDKTLSETLTQDLEQHKRLHQQYHIRLQEEQQKLKRELENSLCNVPDQPLLVKRAEVSSSSPRTQLLSQSKPVDSDDQYDVQSEIRHNVMLSSASIATANELPSANCLDPIMVVYPSVGPTSSPKSRKRGRPPKAPVMPTRILSSESSLLPYDSVFSSVDSNSEAALFPSVNTSVSVNSSFLGHETVQTMLAGINSFTVNEKSKPNTPPSTCDNATEGQMSLEKKINFLTNQIEIEMAQNRAKNISGNADPPENINNNNESMEKRSQQEVGTTLEDKHTENNTKTRRKKTSRMLKSNENFIYATFRFKPRGSHGGVKKASRKNPESSTGVAAAAETIANLRDKKLKGSQIDKSTDKSKVDPLVHAWKFHEQYPCPPTSPKLASAISGSCVCLTCGGTFESSRDNEIQRLPTHCNSCAISKQIEMIMPGNMPTGNVNATDTKTIECKREILHYDSTADERFDSNLNMPNTSADWEDPETDESNTMSTLCTKCGKTFVKEYADPCEQCLSCRQHISSVINSSKLFSLPSTSHPYDNEDAPLHDSSSSDAFNCKQAAENLSHQKVNGLFCSTCRMQFTEIIDYLNHIKQMHEQGGEQTDKEVPQSFLNNNNNNHNNLRLPGASARKTKVSSKNKKSLSHKTITCPVEDCPLFFRHQRDMDFHLKKAHKMDSCGFPATSFNNDSKLSHDDEEPMSPEFSGGLPETMDTTPEVKMSTSAELRSSSQEKPLQCDICDFRCRQKNALTWHMRKHPEAAWQHRRYASINGD